MRIAKLRIAALAAALVAAVAAAPPAPAGRPSRADVDAAYDTLAAANRDLPRDTFDPRAVLETVGRDPAELFAFVRDKTTFVPYHGALRGPAGVLMDRVGNSLDRALLLAELLRLAGEDVRLAHATLPPGVAGPLAAKVRQTPVRPPADPPLADDDRLAAATKQRAAAVEMVAKQSGQVLFALRGGVVPPKPVAPSETPAADAVADHWWVQRNVDGKWADADPLLPDAQLNTAPLATPDRTMAAPTDGLKSLPAELCQEVDVRVIEERWDGGKVTEAAAVARTFRPADVLDRRVALGHVSVPWPAGVGPADPAAYTAAVRDAKEWVPVIYVGGQGTVDKAVTTAGDLTDKPATDRNAATAGLAKVGGGMFGSLGGGGTPSADAATSVWTAEWVEYTVRVPGRPAAVVRRPVFDLLGPAARAAATVPSPAVDPARRLDRGLAVAGQMDVLLLPCRPSPAFMVATLADRLMTTRSAVTAAAAATPGRPAVGRHQVEVSPLWPVAATRFDYNPNGADETYLDQPNVFEHHARYAAADATGAELTVRQVIDLAYNPTAVFARPGTDAFGARVRQGVADTVAEAMALGGGTDAAVVNTATAFRAAGDGTAVVASADGPLPASLGTDADVAARVGQSLADGRAVVAAPGTAAAGTAAAGWWRVDRATGETVGVTANGYHGTIAEDVAARVNALLNLPFVVELEVLQGYTEAEFVELIIGGKGLTGATLLRTFQACCSIYGMIQGLK